MLLKSIFIIIIVIVVSNLIPLDKIFADGSYYRYSNYNGQMTFAEQKSRDFEMMQRRSESYRQTFKNTDSVVYRLFKKTPFAFWRWGQYLISKRYKLPYKDWSEISASRGGPLTNKTGFQDF